MTRSLHLFSPDVPASLTASLPHLAPSRRPRRSPSLAPAPGAVKRDMPNGLIPADPQSLPERYRGRRAPHAPIRGVFRSAERSAGATALQARGRPHLARLNADELPETPARPLLPTRESVKPASV